MTQGSSGMPASRWAVSAEAFDRAVESLEEPARVVEPLRALVRNDGSMESMRRRPGRLACPACKRETDSQPAFTEESGRTFQHFICDTADCPVSSFRVEWRAASTP
jgi:hypothetical protein